MYVCMWCGVYVCGAKGWRDSARLFRCVRVVSWISCTPPSPRPPIHLRLLLQFRCCQPHPVSRHTLLFSGTEPRTRGYVQSDHVLCRAPAISDHRSSSKMRRLFRGCTISCGETLHALTPTNRCTPEPPPPHTYTHTHALTHRHTHTHSQTHHTYAPPAHTRAEGLLLTAWPHRHPHLVAVLCVHTPHESVGAPGHTDRHTDRHTDTDTDLYTAACDLGGSCGRER